MKKKKSTKVRKWKNLFHANGNRKKAGVAILILHKIDFKTKTVKRDTEGHYLRRSTQQENITIIYAPNI